MAGLPALASRWRRRVSKSVICMSGSAPKGDRTCICDSIAGRGASFTTSFSLLAFLPAAAVMGAVKAPGKKGEGNPWKHGIFGEKAAATCTACRVGGKPTATAWLHTPKSLCPPVQRSRRSPGPCASDEMTLPGCCLQAASATAAPVRLAGDSHLLS